MPNLRSITINGSAGAYTTVLCTQWCWRAEVIEDYSANAGVGQGLQYLLPANTSLPQNPTWQTPSGIVAFPTAATAGFEVAPQTEPIVPGSATLPLGGGGAPTLGTGPDNSGGYAIPATPMIMIRSASATGTTIRVTEFP